MEQTERLLSSVTGDLGVKRIQQKHPAACEVTGVARHNGEVMEQGHGNNLFVDGVW